MGGYLGSEDVCGQRSPRCTADRNFEANLLLQSLYNLHSCSSLPTRLHRSLANIIHQSPPRRNGKLGVTLREFMQERFQCAHAAQIPRTSQTPVSASQHSSEGRNRALARFCTFVGNWVGVCVGFRPNAEAFWKMPLIVLQSNPDRGWVYPHPTPTPPPGSSSLYQRNYISRYNVSLVLLICGA